MVKILYVVDIHLKLLSQFDSNDLIMYVAKVPLFLLFFFFFFFFQNNKIHKCYIYPKHSDRHAEANTVISDQIMQNIVSDQDLQSFPLIQQFSDTATGYKMEC